MSDQESCPAPKPTDQTRLYLVSLLVLTAITVAAMVVLDVLKADATASITRIIGTVAPVTGVLLVLLQQRASFVQTKAIHAEVKATGDKITAEQAALRAPAAPPPEGQ